ncbi:MAG: YaiI/YqxD family protein [Clostridia bacterium]|nr:YaiI/YqxD family protein [Clostridia bacterium]
MKIIVDADACPVYKSAVKIAKENSIPCILVCDYNHILNPDYGEVITVDKGHDNADFKIVSLLEKNDMVITQDYGLATLVLSKGGYAMHQTGKLYTEENIDKLLFERFLSAKVRRSGQRTKNMKKFTEQESEQFQKSLYEWIKLNK